ncbi:hypothetical protein HNP46_006025 [Pseudomonas nitritireducens]|uniref:Uncharacterized protein n=1 Tax=Pseudomonas nitroreducens TaxID=46680 RepID=A0A7W7KQH2_PSENT|nr:hypothetical protein [Pseudomonas nitritireducens]MBB4867117.1 hypothetical protein [Pseudomonas nitritireducens]
MGVVAVQVCSSWESTADGLMRCQQFEWQQAYLIPPEAAGAVELLANGGFSLEAFSVGAAGVLGAFVTGLLTGWVASLLRKAR